VDAYDALKTHDPAALANVDIPSDVPVVTVCAAGKTSLVAAEQLAARGLQALSLDGGMKAWSLAWNIAEVPVYTSGVRIIQVRRTGKGCLSYLIGAGEEAMVIDASLDPQVYLDLARSHGWQITRLFDTHYSCRSSLALASACAHERSRCCFCLISSGCRFPLRPCAMATLSQPLT